MHKKLKRTWQKAASSLSFCVDQTFQTQIIEKCIRNDC